MIPFLSPGGSGISGFWAVHHAAIREVTAKLVGVRFELPLQPAACFLALSELGLKPIPRLLHFRELSARGRQRRSGLGELGFDLDCALLVQRLALTCTRELRLCVGELTLLQHPNCAARLLRKLVEAKKAHLYSLSAL